MTTRKIAPRERLTLALILLVAAFLRGQYLLQIEHNIDHAYPIWQALTTLEHGVLPLVGQGTSVLFANPALTGYLFLPFIALTRSPLGAYIVVIALNTLAVLLTYRAARGLLGIRVALIASALLAVNPWVIEYSRTSWVQSLLPFFACASAWLLWPILMGNTRYPVRRLLLALIILTLYTQTYLLAFLILVPVTLLLLIFWRRLPRRALLLGGGIFALATLTYGAGLLGEIGTVGARLNEFSGSPPQLTAEAWNHAVRLVSGEDYEIARGIDAPPHDSALRHNLTRVAHVALYIALLLGLAQALWNFFRRFFRSQSLETYQNEMVLHRGKLPGHSYSAPSIILLLWFALPILLMSYVGQPVHPFYQLIGLPAGHILAAWGLSTVLAATQRWTNGLLFALIVAFAILMGANSSRYYQETAVAPGAHNLTALPLDYGLRLGRVIDDYLPSDGIVFADADAWILNSFAGHTFPVIRDTRLPDVQIIPPTGALVVRMAMNTVETVPYAERVADLFLPDGWIIAVDRYRHATQIDIAEPSHMMSEQGITFLGYSLTQDGATVGLTTFWRGELLTPDIENSFFAPFIHVFDSTGTRVQIVDGQPVEGYEWRMGDIHIHRMTFDLPETGAPFTLQIGQYDSRWGQNVIFVPDFIPIIQLEASMYADF